MDYTKFVNRKEELKALKERINSDKAEMIIVYGKRRVGKTELLNQLGITYILFREESEQNQLKRISEELAKATKEEYLSGNQLTSWDSLFKYIQDKNLKLIFDEFPYAISSSPSLPSILQDHWDNKLRHTKTKIILCGSSIAMMEGLLGYKSPIYGRRTAQLLVEPLGFNESVLFYEGLPNENKVTTYSILGGTPAYILEFDHKKSIKENIREKILRKDAFLYNEVNFVLKEELKEPRTYFSILSSIALGNSKLSDIMNSTGYEKSKITAYLSILEDLRLIKRKVPVTEKNPLKSRKGIYTITDNYFRFWFRYVFQNIEYININKADILVPKIMKDIDIFTSYVFEDICKDFTIRTLKDYTLIGNWWDREQEIDMVAINDDTKEILFGECKWTSKETDADVYYKLKEKSKNVEWNNNDRKEKFAIFSKKGFTKKMKEIAKKDGILLYDLREIVAKK